MKQLLLSQVTDGASQENFSRLQAFLRDFPLFKGSFQFRELTFISPSYPASVVVPHRLGFLPKDVLVTSVRGGTLTWMYEDFTQSNIVATVSAATTVRAFFGTYAEGRLA